MSPTRQQARQAARGAQAGAGPQDRFIEMVAQAVSLGVVQALRGLQTQPGCAVCVHEGKVAEAIARKALEPFEPRIAQSVTVTEAGPVCWEHAEQPAAKVVEVKRLSRAKGERSPYEALAKQVAAEMGIHPGEPMTPDQEAEFTRRMLGQD